MLDLVSDIIDEANQRSSTGLPTLSGLRAAVCTSDAKIVGPASVMP
jgi:hypothetical protein